MKSIRFPRAISLFLLINFLTGMLAPGLAQAGILQTAPPELPAIESLVDLPTGNLNYGVPLLSINSGNLSYPVSFTYNSDIKATETASWIGLGWDFEPGCIERVIKGYPDDFEDATDQEYKDEFVTQEQQYHSYGLLKASKISNYNLNHTFAFDSYSVFDPAKSTIIDNPFKDPDDDIGGSFLSNDYYFVNTPMLNGAMEPRLFENISLARKGRQALSYLDGIVFYLDRVCQHDKLTFRFKNEVSNTARTENVVYMNYDVSPDPGFSYNIGSGNGFDYESGINITDNTDQNTFHGAKTVKYYTCSEISDGTAKSEGFLDYHDLNRSTFSAVLETVNGNSTFSHDISKAVGGFMITDESGYTYHFSIPVFAYKSRSYISTYGTTKGYARDQPYAYKWLLTSITGPDFVDVNTDGYADENDYGQWINFLYTKTEDDYIERFPLFGYDETQDGTKAYSGYYKERYYLDAIYTRDNLACFDRSDRNDNRGANSITGNGGMKDPNINDGERAQSLENILLMNKEYYQADMDATGSSTYYDVALNASAPTIWNSFLRYVEKQIALTHNYDLMPRSDLLSNQTGNYMYSGKLTLEKINFYSYQNGSLGTYQPPYEFVYDLNVSASIGNISSYQDLPFNEALITANSSVQLKEGDIVQFTGIPMDVTGVEVYYCTIKSISSQTSSSGTWTTTANVLFIADKPTNTNQQQGATADLYLTKNPAYSWNSRDVWNSFKSDYISAEGYNRNNSPLQSAAADCWLLRKIVTPLSGTIQIDYESDSYSQIGINQQKRLLNVNPNIGFKVTSNAQSSYDCLPHDDTYIYHYHFEMDALDRSQPSATFRLKFSDENLGDALTANLSVGDAVEMGTMSSLSTTLSDGELKSQISTTSCHPTIAAVGNNYIDVTIPKDSSGLFLSQTGTFSGATYVAHEASYVVIPEKKMQKAGGGVRVNEITLSGNNETFSYQLDYTNPLTGVSSGVTSYDPADMNRVEFNFPYWKAQTVPCNVFDPRAYQTYSTIKMPGQQDLLNYKKLFVRDFYEYSCLISRLPRAAVLYRYVTVRSFGNERAYTAFKQYQFNTFTTDMFQKELLSESYQDYQLPGQTLRTRNLKFHDRSSQLGQLVAEQTFDPDGTLIKSKNYYYSDGTDYNGLGIVEEIYHEMRETIDETYTTTIKYKGLVCICASYPCILQKIEETDYQKGTTSQITFTNYDFFNQNPTEIETTDSYGNTLVKKTTYAYNMEAGGSTYEKMGPKSMNSSWYNKLTSVADIGTYKKDASGNYKLIQRSATTYQESGIYRAFNSDNNEYEWQIPVGIGRLRPLAGYHFQSALLENDGTIAESNYYDLDFSNPVEDLHWKKNSQVMHYDPFSRVIEATDINGNYTCTHWGYDYSKVIAKVRFANYASATYSGFEARYHPAEAPSYWHFDGEVLSGNLMTAAVDGIQPHSGKYMIAVPANSAMTTIYKVSTSGNTGEFSTGRSYRACIWVNKATINDVWMYVSLSGTYSGSSYSQTYSSQDTEPLLSSGNWSLIYVDFPVPSGYQGSVQVNLSTGGVMSDPVTGFFDDFRLHPVDAQIQSFVYDPVTGRLTHVLDKNNIYTRFEYDNEGRISKVYRETKKGEIKLKQYDYHFGNL